MSAAAPVFSPMQLIGWTGREYPEPAPLTTTNTKPPEIAPATSTAPATVINAEKFVNSVSELIDECCDDSESYEDGEPRPSKKAREELKAIIRDAESHIGKKITTGHIAPYFGEVGITWRRGSSMLCLTAFSDQRTARLDYGTTPPGTLGNYEFEQETTGANLADKLRWLYGQTNG